MAQKKNKKNTSGQLARLSQNQNANQNQKTVKQSNGSSVKGMQNGGSFGAAVAYSSPTVNRPPIVNSNAKCSRIIHKELIATVSGNTTYGVTSYALNPGLATTFPWLSTVAPSYEQYTFRSLRFHYVTRCATTYAGSVLLSPEYDALDSAPSTEVLQAMMAGSIEDVPWRNQTLVFSSKDMFPMGPRKFVRSASVSSSDLKTYDAGQLFVGLAGCADTTTIGKLWVEYDVDLYIPQNPSAGTVGGVGSSSLFTLHSAMSQTTGVAKLVAFDTTAFDGINITNTGGSFTLPSGTYAIETVISASGAGVTTGANITVTVEIYKDGSASSPVYKTQGSFGALAATSFIIPTTVLGNITSTGTNAVAVYITTTCSTGTLTCLADACQVRILRIA